MDSMLKFLDGLLDRRQFLRRTLSATGAVVTGALGFSQAVAATCN